MKTKAIAATVAGLVSVWLCYVLLVGSPPTGDEQIVAAGVAEVGRSFTPYGTPQGAIYTPVFYFLAAMFPHPDPLVAGRWVSLLATVVLVSALTYRFGIWFFVIILLPGILLTPDFRYWVAACRVDMLAVLFAVGGFMAKNTTHKILLLAAAVATKQTLGAAVVVTALSAPGVALWAAGLALVVSIAPMLSSGFQDWRQASAGAWDGKALGFYARSWPVVHSFPLWALVIRAFRPWDAWTAYAVVSWGLAAVALARTGSSTNHLLEPTLVSAIAVWVWVVEKERRTYSFGGHHGKVD